MTCCAVMSGPRCVATPRVDPPPGEGALGVGIGLANTMATLSPLASLREGAKETAAYAMMILQLPAMMIGGQMPAGAQVSGSGRHCAICGRRSERDNGHGIVVPDPTVDGRLERGAGDYEHAPDSGAGRRPVVVHLDRSFARDDASTRSERGWCIWSASWC